MTLKEPLRHDRPEPPPEVPEGWEDLLDPGERILWQRQPDPGLHIRKDEIILICLGVYFAFVGLRSVVLDPVSFFPMVQVAIGLYFAAVPTVWKQVKQRHTWYTLTDRRAIIATNPPLMTRKLTSYPILPDTRIELSEGPRDSVHFAETFQKKGRKSRRAPIGFELIGDEGPKVMSLIREIQAGQSGHAEPGA